MGCSNAKGASDTNYKTKEQRKSNGLQQQWVYQPQMFYSPQMVYVDPYIQYQQMMMPVAAKQQFMGQKYLPEYQLKEFEETVGDTPITMRVRDDSDKKVIGDLEEEWSALCEYEDFKFARFLSRVIAYYNNMEEFKTSPPEKNGPGETVPYHMDFTFCMGSQGHKKGKLAHGIAIGNDRRKAGNYVGTFVEGKKHGYGIQFYGCPNEGKVVNYYEGEFQDNRPHGQGKFTAFEKDCDTINEVATKEGLWEYGSFVPVKRVTEEYRQYCLQLWSLRQDQLLQVDMQVKAQENANQQMLHMIWDAQMEAWQNKREKERKDEIIWEPKHAIDIWIELKHNDDMLQAKETCVHPENVAGHENYSEDLGETKDTISSIIAHYMNGKAINCYTDKKITDRESIDIPKDGGNGAIWVKRREPKLADKLEPSEKQRSDWEDPMKAGEGEEY